MSNPFQHEPFFNRQCDKCHIPVDSSGYYQEFSQNYDQATGAAVGPEKREIIRSGSQTVDHLVSLENLVLTSPYKFRLILRNNEPAQDNSEIVTTWQEVVPFKIAETCEEWIPPAIDGFRVADETKISPSQSAMNRIRSFSICRVGDSFMVMSWKTNMACEGWIEIEGIRRKEISEANPTEKQHPQLNDPEWTSIDACYSCHTQESLGTTHSIRVYSGEKTKIPSDLPTVKGGMITCVTCHYPHGGGGKHFVRKKITTKLCISCHFTFKGTSKSTVFRD